MDGVLFVRGYSGFQYPINSQKHAIPHPTCPDLFWLFSLFVYLQLFKFNFL